MASLNWGLVPVTPSLVSLSRYSSNFCFDVSPFLKEGMLANVFSSDSNTLTPLPTLPWANANKAPLITFLAWVGIENAVLASCDAPLALRK